jgi:hypothetical protein
MPKKNLKAAAAISDANDGNPVIASLRRMGQNARDQYISSNR